MTAAGPGPVIALTANTSWYAWHYRAATIRAITDRGCSVAVIAPPDESVPQLAGIPGVTHYPWALDLNGQNPLREARSLAALYRLVRNTRPDFLFSFSTKPNIYAGLVSRMTGIPYAPNVTGLGMVVGRGGLVPTLTGRLYAYVASGAHTLFVQNASDLGELQRLGLKPGVRVRQLRGSGVDLDRFAFVPLPPPEPLTFVLIGRLQRDKGIEDFVAAAHALKEKGVGARYVVVGGTDFANKSAIPAERLEAWKAAGIVEFAGNQSDVRPWLGQAHAVVLPSHGGEGTPRVLLEAASAGRPAIVSDVPGCRDAVKPAETGLVHRPADVSSLAAAMLEFAAMPPARRAEMGRQARQLAEAGFSETAAVTAYLDCLQDLPVNRR